MLEAINRSLAAKVSIAVSLVLIFFMGVLAVADIRSESRNTLNSYRRNAELLSSTIEKGLAAAMEDGRNGDVQKALEDLGSQPEIKGVRIFDERGVILRSSRASEIGGAVERETLARYLQGGGQADSVVEAGNVFSFTKPIHNGPRCFGCHPSGKRVNGVLNVRISVVPAYEDIARDRRFMLKWGLLCLLCTVLLEVWLLRVLVGGPVRRLREAMKKAEWGEEFTLDTRGTDELGDLCRSFGVMLDTIGAMGKEALARENDLLVAREAQRAQAMITSLMDAMPDGVAILDRDMRLVLMNPRYSHMFPEVRIGEHCYANIHRRDKACPQCGVVKVFADGLVHEHHSRVRMPDGSRMVVHSISAPISGKDGGVLNAVEVVRDVTERAELETQLKDKTQELELANKRLSKMAVTDGLTALFNHRYFQDSLKREFKRLSRHKAQPFLSLAMIDIDRFKDLNDAYGHQAGDQVLRGISKILKDGVRLTDVVARYGGEEFVVIMPETDFDGMGVAAERIRAGVEAAVFEYGEHKMKVTVSIGLACCPTDEVKTEDDLLKAADRALYQAKQEGRNRVVVTKGI